MTMESRPRPNYTAVYFRNRNFFFSSVVGSVGRFFFSSFRRYRCTSFCIADLRHRDIRILQSHFKHSAKCVSLCTGSRLVTDVVALFYL